LSQISQALGRTRGEPEAEASRLYHEYHDKLLRYCVGQLRSREEAEDAVQNTFLRVFTALRKGVVPEFEGPWLYKIAHNVCLSKRLGSSRRARVETPVDLDLLGDRAAAYSADADELFGLDDALADMPANLRRPLLMREWQGMSYAEIADALGVSHSAVETLIFRARRHLASALTDSVQKSGKAIASVFNIRWLFNLLKGLGGGAGSAGMAAGAASLVVAIGGGVAIDLATQSASASHRTAAGAAAGAPVVNRFSPTANLPAASRTGAAASRGAIAQATTARSTSHAGKAGKSFPGSHSGAPASSSGSTSGSSSSSAGAASSPGSTKSPSPSRPGGSASSGRSGSGSGTKGSKPKGAGSGSGSGLLPGLAPPSVPTPTVPAPPTTIPSVPPLAPPSVSPPPLPPPPPLPSPPTINVPGSLVAEATGPAGAVVAYTVTATDVADGSDPVSCAPASGSKFHLGHTTVSCSSTDKAGNTSTASFDVLVHDTTPPDLTVPGDITVKAGLASGAKVTFTATAKDLVDSAPAVTCNPASGSLFVIQTTTVTCTATDSAGNSSSKSFTVTVKL